MAKGGKSMGKGAKSVSASPMNGIKGSFMAGKGKFGKRGKGKV